VVEPVRHPLVDGAIDTDVDDVANPVSLKLNRRWWRTMFLVLASEEVTSPPTKPTAVSH
jgi:hypothetical protein